MIMDKKTIVKNAKTTSEIEYEKENKTMQGIATWTSFYRANPHRFCSDYLNIHLHLFQQILLYMMNISHFFMFIASRGLGKTFLTAVFAVVRCVLYPNTYICVASGTRGQALEVLKKITDILMLNSENLRFEIKDVKNNATDAYVEFKNGSKIFAVASNHNSRGNRCNILILDEFRMLDKEILESVLRNFNAVSRQVGYSSNPKYSHLVERNKEIYLTSAWYKSHWSFEKLKAYVVNLVNDTKQYFVCGLPYELAIKEGLLNKDDVVDKMSESDFNELYWMMEMECLWYGDTEGSLFNYEDIVKNRKIENIYYPKHIREQLSLSDKFSPPPLIKDERRILSADIALLASRKQNNDASSIWINSAIPTSSGKYINNFIYTENHEGLRTEELALKIRRLYEEFNCTDIVLDVKGLGIGVYDALSDDMYDPDYGIVYPALSCCNDDTYAERCTNRNAPKVIWAIQASSKFNNDMYLTLRDGFIEKKINLPISEFEIEEKFNDKKGFKNLDYTKRNIAKLPYIHTTLLINELINLQTEVSGSVIKVKEKSGMRKDRVSSIGYNFWVSKQLELKLKKQKAQNVFEDIDMFCFKQPKVK